jgi:uncharacterized protein YodC (DUF2158 family)
MPQTFKPGDIVQLKSGGPIMTVLETSEIGVSTAWFAYGKCKRTHIEAQALKAATAPDKSGKSQ